MGKHSKPEESPAPGAAPLASGLGDAGVHAAAGTSSNEPTESRYTPEDAWHDYKMGN